jgi:ribonucleoside-diphosphate reductase beta chain
MNEPILINNPNRFVLFPIEHQDLWEHYLNQKAAMWTVEEIDLSKDIAHWETKLTDNAENENTH